MELSNPFNIARGVLQADIFSPVAFVVGLERIFRRHDVHTAGVTVGSGESFMNMSKFEYADDAAVVDDDAATSTTRVTAIVVGSLNDATMVISDKKSNTTHMHPTTRVSATKEAEVVALKLNMYAIEYVICVLWMWKWNCLIRTGTMYVCITFTSDSAIQDNIVIQCWGP